MEEDVRGLPHSTSTDYLQNYGCFIWHFFLHGIKIYSSHLTRTMFDSKQNALWNFSEITVKIFMLNHFKNATRRTRTPIDVIF